MSSVRNPNIMSVRRASEISGRDVKTIRRWYQKGAIRKYVTPGGRVEVDVRECLSREQPPERGHAGA